MENESESGLNAGVEQHIEHLEEEVGELAENVPSQLVEIRRIVELLRRESFTGPIPPPEILEGYAQVHPEAPAIIFSELVQQGRHRRELEASALTHQERRADRGQWCAFAIVLSTLVAAVVCTLAGQPWVGASLFGSSLVAVVFAFLRGSRQQELDLARKRQQLEASVPKPDAPDQASEGPLGDGPREGQEARD